MKRLLQLLRLLARWMSSLVVRRSADAQIPDPPISDQQLGGIVTVRQRSAADVAVRALEAVRDVDHRRRQLAQNDPSLNDVLGAIELTSIHEMHRIWRENKED